MAVCAWLAAVKIDCLSSFRTFSHEGDIGGVVVAGLRRDAKNGAKEGRAARSSSIVKETAAERCLGRSLVEASVSLDVARLYSTDPRARPP